MSELRQLNQRITACERCPRLRTYCQQVARTKRASFRDQTYWGRPVPNLLPTWGRGSAESARLLIVGLAPAAHGANRTGRMFTGDRSGDFLFRGLYEVGLANQPTATDADDGLALRGVAITSAVHCAPPANKPAPDEIAACSEYLTKTFDALSDLRVVLTLGALGHRAAVREYRQRGWIRQRGGYRFGHGAAYEPDGDGPSLVCCYHPSQQNTFTGRLTPAMLREVLTVARDRAGLEAGVTR